MGREIERKFLVRGEEWRNGAVRSVNIRQGYLASTGRLSLRVRLRDDGAAFLTLKSAEPGISRAEFEYPIPLEDAEALIAIAGTSVVEKRRHDVMVDGRKWEVDVFAGRHAGLVVAEVELEREDAGLTLPPWAGGEVTNDPGYRNEALAKA